MLTRAAVRALSVFTSPPGAPFSPLPPAPPGPAPSFVSSETFAKAGAFACPGPSAQLLANSSHAVVVLTHWSQAGQDAQPVPGRTAFALATWSPQAVQLPAGSASAAEAARDLLTIDPAAYVGTCSLAAAGRRFPFFANFTRTPPALPSGLDTLALAPQTLQAAGCACASAYLEGGTEVRPPGCGGGPGFYVSNANSSPTWLISQASVAGGPCTLRTRALFASPLMRLPFASVARGAAGEALIDAKLTVTEVTSGSALGSSSFDAGFVVRTSPLSLRVIALGENAVAISISNGLQTAAQASKLIRSSEALQSLRKGTSADLF